MHASSQPKPRLLMAANLAIGVYCLSPFFAKTWFGPEVFAGMLAATLLLVLLSSHRLRMKLLLVPLVLGVSLPWAFYHLLSHAVLAIATPAPYVQVTAPQEQVVLGGGHIVLSEFMTSEYSGVALSTSFYLPDGLVVGAAHAVGLDQVSCSAILNHNGQIQTGKAEILRDTDAGVLLQLTGINLPAEPLMSIAGTSDIQTSAEAELFPGVGPSSPVKVVGYHQEDGKQYLVMTIVDGAEELVPGMSGSPIVQNGSIIGCMARIYDTEYKGQGIFLARLAADVYNETTAGKR